MQKRVKPQTSTQTFKSNQLENEDNGYERGYVIADGDEGDAGWAEADEAKECVSIVDGRGVEQRGHHLRESTDRRDHSLPRDAA